MGLRHNWDVIKSMDSWGLRLCGIPVPKMEAAARWVGSGTSWLGWQLIHMTKGDPTCDRKGNSHRQSWCLCICSIDVRHVAHISTTQKQGWYLYSLSFLWSCVFLPPNKGLIINKLWWWISPLIINKLWLAFSLELIISKLPKMPSFFLSQPPWEIPLPGKPTVHPCLAAAPCHSSRQGSGQPIHGSSRDHQRK